MNWCSLKTSESGCSRRTIRGGIRRGEAILCGTRPQLAANFAFIDPFGWAGGAFLRGPIYTCASQLRDFVTFMYEEIIVF